MKRQWALQVGAQRKPCVGDDSVGSFSKGRNDAQERRFGRMQKRIVRLGGASSDDLENLLTLAREIGGDLRRKAIGPMAGYADLNHEARPRRRT